MSRRPTRTALVAALLGVAVVVPSPAASAAAVPASHVEVCRDTGLGGASTMTLLSTRTGRDRSGTSASVARAWVYAVAGTDLRCVVVRLDGATVARKPGRTPTNSVGHQVLQSGQLVVDTGEVLPFSGEVVSSSGSTRSTRLVAEVVDLSETDTVPADAGDFLPPELAGLAGHHITVTTTSLDIVMSATSWTESRLARPMSAAQARKKQAAEVARARAVLAARIAAATTQRDATLAQAASTTGLTASWLQYVATQQLEAATGTARTAFAASRRMAREHARLARRGVDVRQAYDHEVRLAVPLT